MTRSWRALLAATVLLSVLPGCLVSPDASSPVATAGDGFIDPSPVYMAIRAQMADVPCTASVTSTATSDNLKGLADSQLNDMGPAHSHGEFDIHDDLLLDPNYSTKGFSLVDITNPLEPVQLSYLADPSPSTGRGSTETLDAKFSADGKNVLLGYSDSMGLADVTDPRHPTLLAPLANPRQYTGQTHMMYDAVINGVEYVFGFPSVTGDGMFVNKLTGSGPDAKLSFVAFYDFVDTTSPTRQPVAPHDGYVVYDAVVGHHLLYLANSFHGVQVLNVDDPAHPVLVASAAANADGSATGALPTFYHSVQSAWIDGKRIVVTSAEVGYNTLKVFDFTDFKSPRFLGQWVFDQNQPTNMQHNIQIVNGTLFEVHYGQGLFGFDLAGFVAKKPTELPMVFHWQPRNGGSFWDVQIHKGVLYVSDQGQGLHVLGYGCMTPGDERLESTG